MYFISGCLFTLSISLYIGYEENIHVHHQIAKVVGDCEELLLKQKTCIRKISAIEFKESDLY